MSGYRWTIEWARNCRVQAFGELESSSTNMRAKESLSFLSDGSVVLADHQTQGRGRGDHTWTDCAGQNLLSSWVFYTRTPPQPITSSLVGLALFKAASATWPTIPFTLKAPNDLHVIEPKSTTAGKASVPPLKIGGLLIEVVSQDPTRTVLIIGLGLNVHGSPQATSPYGATHLSAELARRGGNLTETDFRRFLTAWHGGLTKAVQDGQKTEMTATAARELKKALTAHPEFSDLQTVHPDGSLDFKDGRSVRWTEL